MGYIICFIIGLMCGVAALALLLHKMSDGEIWSVFGGGRRDYDDVSPGQPVQYVDPGTMYDPFKDSWT